MFKLEQETSPREGILHRKKSEVQRVVLSSGLDTKHK